MSPLHTPDVVNPFEANPITAAPPPRVIPVPAAFPLLLGALGMLAGMGRLTEFETHFRGALRNGMSQDELKEILMQIAVYCGVPMGMEVFRIARRVFDEQQQ